MSTQPVTPPSGEPRLGSPVAKTRSRPAGSAVTSRPCDRAPRASRQHLEARPALDGAQPRDVRRGDRQCAHDGALRARLLVVDERGERLRRTARVLALGHGVVRQLRGGGRRRTGQGAGRHASGRAPRHHRPRRSIRRTDRGCGKRHAAGRRPGRVRGRRRDSERRHGRGRDRERRRVRHHRRIGAGDPRVRRRPLRGDGRHARPVRSDRCRDQRQARRDVSRPHDRARRGCVSAEDTE